MARYICKMSPETLLVLFVCVYLNFFLHTRVLNDIIQVIYLFDHGKRKKKKKIVSMHGKYGRIGIGIVKKIINKFKRTLLSRKKI